MQHKTLLLLGGLLAGCASLPADDPIAPGDCGASRVQGLVDQPFDESALPPGLNVRVIDPDTAVTLDFNPERLNIRLDNLGTVVTVDCG